MSLLEAAGLGRAIDVPGAERRWLFRGLSFALDPGETLALRGPVGCGKSLLLRGLAWLDDLDEGTVRLEGRDPPGWGVPAWRSRVVYLHQSPAVGPGTVEDHLREPFGFAVHRTRPFDRERAAAALDAFGRRPGFLEREALELSGGERQVLAVVRAILLEPLVLLLDEPTSALDPTSSSRFEARLGEWAAGGSDRGVIWVTHDRSQADRVAGRILDLAP